MGTVLPSTNLIHPEDQLPREIKGKLLRFAKLRRRDELVSQRIQTHKLIRALWTGATSVRRKDPDFLNLLMTLGWTNETENGKGRDSTIIWRNTRLANYVACSPDCLAESISNKFSGLQVKAAASLLTARTGITNYYHPLRPRTIVVVEENPRVIAAIFRKVASSRVSTDRKIHFAFRKSSELGAIRGTSLLNGLSPALACLDPMLRFPILNARTRPLRRALRLQCSPSGAIEYCDLIGKLGISNSLDLDAFALWYSRDTYKRRRKKLGRAPDHH